jgi:DNA-binding MarR family transcriptional regulator
MAMTDNPRQRMDQAGGDAVSLGVLDSRLGYALRRAQIAVFQDFFRAVAAFDLSPAKYSVLAVVEANPGLSQTQVADVLGIQKTNFVAMIKDLERRDLVRRTPMLSDRRSYALELGETGKVILAGAHDASAAHEARVRAALGADIYDAMFERLHNLAKLGKDSTAG